jgi:hypothetical protein
MALVSIVKQQMWLVLLVLVGCLLHILVLGLRHAKVPVAEFSASWVSRMRDTTLPQVTSLRFWKLLYMWSVSYLVKSAHNLGREVFPVTWACERMPTVTISSLSALGWMPRSCTKGYFTMSLIFVTKLDCQLCLMWVHYFCDCDM